MKDILKEHLPNFIAMLPVAILFLDNKGDCIYANKSFEQLIGVKDGQALGKGWLIYRIAKERKRTVHIGTEKVIKMQFVHPSSGIIWIKLIPSGVVAGLSCYIGELITKDQQAHASEKLVIEEDADLQIDLMQEILDSTDAILYSVDPQGRITAYNKAARQAIQLRKGVALKLGDYWQDIVSGNSGLEKERMIMLLEEVISGKSYKTIESILSEDGEKITYSVQAGPIFDSQKKKVTGAVLCALNITTLARLQEEAAEKALVRAHELESWNDFYNMLLSVLAHDLRQPLSVIILSAELVISDPNLLSAGEMKELMSNMRSICSKSIELLQGLLHWVKSKKEDFFYKPMPLTLFDLISEANYLFLRDQEKKGISLHNEIAKDQILYAHEQMMLFVCRNLINNATKYAPNNSAIYIRSIVSESEITIIVQDSGGAMSDSQLNGLFSIKENTNNVAGINGVGMALTIAHDMIRQMNGRIWVESEKGVSTTFYMTFPAHFLPD